MSSESSISEGTFDDHYWLRCEGRGSFQQSATLKMAGERMIASGARSVVVDLQACTSMDSTFMGTLAGLAAKLRKHGGKVHVVGLDERNRAALEDLGLEHVLVLDSPQAAWIGREHEIRQQLKPVAVELGQLKRQVLDAHRELIRLSEDNAAKFGEVVAGMQRELGGAEGASPLR